MRSEKENTGREQPKNAAERVREFALPVITELSLALWDVEFEKVGGQWELTVYIEHFNEEGTEVAVTIDDCERVSHALDPLLDRYDPIEESYTFHVSSAGLERTLKKEEQFRRFMGSSVEIRLYKTIEGAKVHEGKLSSYEDGSIGLITADGRALSFPASDVAVVRTRFDWRRPL